jgi:hypothetical protein
VGEVVYMLEKTGSTSTASIQRIFGQGNKDAPPSNLNIHEDTHTKFLASSVVDFLGGIDAFCNSLICFLQVEREQPVESEGRHGDSDRSVTQEPHSYFDSRLREALREREGIERVLQENTNSDVGDGNRKTRGQVGVHKQSQINDNGNHNVSNDGPDLSFVDEIFLRQKLWRKGWEALDSERTARKARGLVHGSGIPVSGGTQTRERKGEGRKGSGNGKSKRLSAQDSNRRRREAEEVEERGREESNIRSAGREESSMPVHASRNSTSAAGTAPATLGDTLQRLASSLLRHWPPRVITKKLFFKDPKNEKVCEAFIDKLAESLGSEGDSEEDSERNDERHGEEESEIDGEEEAIEEEAIEADSETPLQLFAETVHANVELRMWRSLAQVLEEECIRQLECSISFDQEL